MLPPRSHAMRLDRSHGRHRPDPRPFPPYAGLEGREIKKLVRHRSGRSAPRARMGTGPCRRTETACPGPAHLLELQAELGLDAGQVAAIEDIFAAMQSEAQEAGERFIAAEAAIEASFSRWRA